MDGDDQNGESSSSDGEEEDGAEEVGEEEVGEEEDAMHQNETEEEAWEGEEGAADDGDGAADDETQSHWSAHESLPLESLPPAAACQGTQQEPLVVLVSEEVRREEVELAIAAMGSLALLVSPPDVC